MNAVMGAGAAAIFIEGKVPYVLASALTAGGTLFFGGSMVEELSHEVAYACFNRSGALHILTQKIVSISLKAFAVFAVVNLGASALSGFVVMPLSAGAAGVCGLMHESFNSMLEILFASQAEVNSARVYNLQDPLEQQLGNQIGFVGDSGRSAIIYSPSKGGTGYYPLLTLAEQPLKRPIPRSGKCVLLRVEGREGDVIIKNDVVYERKPSDFPS